MSETPDSSDRQPSKHRSWFVLMLLLLVLYPLSLRPYVGYLARRSGGQIRSDDLWPYRPLFPLFERSPTLRRALDSYLRLFL